MSHEREARRDERDEAETAGVAPGRRSLVASRYPALAQALGDRREGGEPTIHDAATAAVENKGSGSAVDSGVAAQVGAHLGTDFSNVRVHSDPLAQQATAAIGARAFAYGADVFLGAGESGGDVGLMAHELTHVAQQGAAGQRAVQRQVQVGDADSPAEREADQVAAQVTSGQGQPTSLLVDDGPVQPGQMLKSQFIERLRAEVTAAADAELGPMYSAIGCPQIEQYFGRYAGQPASAGEALVRRYAPATRTARTAADMIPAVVARVREGVRQWRDTGQAPPDVAAMAPSATSTGAAAGPAQAQALRAPGGGETLASLEAELGPGQSLDGATASRMSDALGIDVSAARIHTGPVAARKAADAGAVAFAVGANVVMGAGAPGAGTLEGDALLAHELAHTAQQAGAANDPAARRQPIGTEDASAEDHADAAAVGAVEHLHGDTGVIQRLGGPEHEGDAGQLGGIARLWDGAKAAARAASAAVKSGISLARCSRNERPSPTGVHYERGAHPSSNPTPSTWGMPGVTQDESADHDEVLNDAAAMNGGGVFVFYGHGNSRAVQSDDRRAVSATELGTALGRDSDPPTVVVLGACSTSGMISQSIGAGVGVVVGFDDSVNSVFLSGTLDAFMSDLNAGRTFAEAQRRANQSLARAPMGIGQMVIEYGTGYGSSMTLEEARARGRAPRSLDQ